MNFAKEYEVLEQIAAEPKTSKKQKILPPEKVEEIFGSDQMSALYEQSAISIENCSIDIINDGTNNIFIEECRPK